MFRLCKSRQSDYWSKSLTFTKIYFDGIDRI